jgi:hypothetical protein
LDFCCCKMALSVGVYSYFLANAEEHFVWGCQIVITAPSCVLHRTQMHYPVLLVAADVGGTVSPSTRNFSISRKSSGHLPLSLPYYQETVRSLKCASKRWISFTPCKIQKNIKRVQSYRFWVRNLLKQLWKCLVHCRKVACIEPLRTISAVAKQPLLKVRDCCNKTPANFKQIDLFD